MGSNFVETAYRKEGMQCYAAPSLFQPHRTRQAIRDAYAGKIPPMIGYFGGLASVPVTRLLAPMGWDCCWIDWEHNPCNVETMTTMVHEIMFLSQGRTIPWVRVPGHDHAAIGWAMDAGASIIVPQVDTVEQAQHVVSAAKFGSVHNGTRSVPPFRLIEGLTDATHDPSKDIYRNLNDQAAVMIQIESLKGIENLDRILTEVPDIDAVWLGRLDARVSMNLAAPNGGFGGTEPEWLKAEEKFYQVLKKHKKPYGGFYRGPLENITEVAKNQQIMFIAADVLALLGMNDKLVEARQHLHKRW